MTKDDFKNFVESNQHLVTMKETSIPDVFVLKYKKKVFYDNLWNDFLEDCRGTLVDKDFNLISRPFRKIYNFNVEVKAPKLTDDTPITAMRKVNGFMVAVTWHNGDVLVSTTGSTDSPYVQMAKDSMDMEQMRRATSATAEFTWLFECVHPNDPHIIPEEPGLYLLGMRSKTWDIDLLIYDDYSLSTTAKHFGFRTVETFRTTVGELVELSKTVKHEGFVAYTEDKQSFKIKSPYYLIKKFVARNPRTDKLMDTHVKEKVDEEYYGLLAHIQANIVEFTAMTEQARLGWVSQFLETN